MYQATAREEHAQREINRLLEERRIFALKRQVDIDAASEQTRQRASLQRKGCEEGIHVYTYIYNIHVYIYMYI
jgi:hypothetical protein